AVHQRGNLSGGTAVTGVAAQHAEQRIEIARAADALVALPLVPPEHQQAVAAMEVEVVGVLVGRAIERPQGEGRADAARGAAPGGAGRWGGQGRRAGGRPPGWRGRWGAGSRQTRHVSSPIASSRNTTGHGAPVASEPSRWSTVCV